MYFSRAHVAVTCVQLEQSFEQDKLLDKSHPHNGPAYREVREYRSERHRVRFYFLTRIYSPYVQWILGQFHRDPKPDVIIVNSCLWDISRSVHLV